MECQDGGQSPLTALEQHQPTQCWMNNGGLLNFLPELRLRAVKHCLAHSGAVGPLNKRVLCMEVVQKSGSRRWSSETHKSPVSIMCSLRRSTSTSRLPAGVMPRARHWMRRSFIMRCFRVSLMEEPSILRIEEKSHDLGLQEWPWPLWSMWWLQPGVDQGPQQ